MRPVAPDPGGHRYLLKALREAGNELAEELYGCSRRLADHADADGWTPRMVAIHLRVNEEMTWEYVRRILGRRRAAKLPVIDTEAMRDNPADFDESLEEAAMGYQHTRERLQYTLWELDSDDWSRTGDHPYRGAISIEQLVRDLHWHDLEYMWRLQRLKEAAAVGRR